MSRIVAITGGARGIGLATARALRRRGYRVAVGDLDGATVADAASGIDSTVLGAQLDVTSRVSFGEFLALVERELGPVDVLINNAGIMPIGRMVDESEATARRVMEVNVLGCLNGMSLALPAMLARGDGHVVNVASIAGKAPVPGGASYAASKAAIISLTESARVEHHRSGVDFTCVMPSFTATDLILGTKGTKVLKTIQPDDVAKAIAGAVDKPRPDVFLPRVLGPMVNAQVLMGRTLRDASQRAIGAYDTFLDVDQSERRRYDDRIGKTDDAADAPPRVGRPG